LSDGDRQLPGSDCWLPAGVRQLPDDDLQLPDGVRESGYSEKQPFLAVPAPFLPKTDGLPAGRDLSKHLRRSPLPAL
jgi:hypothetical protein